MEKVRLSTADWSVEGFFARTFGDRLLGVWRASEGSAVVIATRRVHGADADHVEIRVIDNGPGFLSDIVHQAFDPYVTSKPKGTGLGLAIVKKLVEEHGGQIAARNREQGGAEISILMPISVDAGESVFSRRHDHRRERA